MVRWQRFNILQIWVALLLTCQHQQSALCEKLRKAAKKKILCENLRKTELRKAAKRSICKIERKYAKSCEVMRKSAKN